MRLAEGAGAGEGVGGGAAGGGGAAATAEEGGGGREEQGRKDAAGATVEIGERFVGMERDRRRWFERAKGL
jgi:hypothetical protein